MVAPPIRRWLLGPSAIGAAAVLAVLAIWSVSASTFDAMRVPQPRDVWDAAVQLAVKGYAGGTLPFHILHSVSLLRPGSAT